MNRYEDVHVLAKFFCQEEIKNFESVSKKLGIALKDFVLMNFPTREYCFVTMNTDISSTYMFSHLHYQPSNREQDSFIKQVNKGMNKFLSEL